MIAAKIFWLARLQEVSDSVGNHVEERFDRMAICDMKRFQFSQSPAKRPARERSRYSSRRAHFASGSPQMGDSDCYLDGRNLREPVPGSYFLHLEPTHSGRNDGKSVS